MKLAVSVSMTELFAHRAGLLSHSCIPTTCLPLLSPIAKRHIVLMKGEIICFNFFQFRLSTYMFQCVRQGYVLKNAKADK